MEEYIKKFLEEFTNAINQISISNTSKFIKILQEAYDNKGCIYLIGNGGSAAIASHFANDLNKTVLGHKKILNRSNRFRAISLVDNTPLLTAWANDVGYEFVFAEQLKNFIEEKDVLIAISSSGNSKNIIKAVQIAKKKRVPIIGMVGFNGGKLYNLADVKIFVPSKKYTIVESAHELICHLVVAYFEAAIKKK